MSQKLEKQHPSSGKKLEKWRPQRVSNPRSHLERVDGKTGNTPPFQPDHHQVDSSIPAVSGPGVGRYGTSPAMLILPSVRQRNAERAAEIEAIQISAKGDSDGQ